MTGPPLLERTFNPKRTVSEERWEKKQVKPARQLSLSLMRDLSHHLAPSLTPGTRSAGLSVYEAAFRGRRLVGE